MANIPSELVIAAEHRYLNIVDVWIAAFITRVPGVESNEQFAQDLVLAVHETVANLVDHAYGGRGGRIYLSIQHDGTAAAVVVEIKDEGAPLLVTDLSHTVWRMVAQGYDLMSVEEPTWDQIRGRGLFLIHTLTDSVHYRHTADANCWTLVKRLPDADSVV